MSYSLQPQFLIVDSSGGCCSDVKQRFFRVLNSGCNFWGQIQNINNLRHRKEGNCDPREIAINI